MSIRIYLFLGGAVLALGLCSLSAPAADEKSPNETIDKLAAALQKDPDAAKKKAEELAKTIDTDDLMGVLNKRSKDGGGGFGFGAKPTGEKDDSIERKVESLAKTPLNAGQLAKESADLEKLTQRIAAVAAVASAKAPPKVVPGGAKKWNDFADMMAKSTKELNKAIQDKDPKAVQAAANRMDGACKDCHAIWR